MEGKARETCAKQWRNTRTTMGLGGGGGGGEGRVKGKRHLDLDKREERSKAPEVEEGDVGHHVLWFYVCPLFDPR